MNWKRFEKVRNGNGIGKGEEMWLKIVKVNEFFFLCIFSFVYVVIMFSFFMPFNQNRTMIRSQCVREKGLQKIERVKEKKKKKKSTIIEWKINGIVWFHRFSDTSSKIYKNPLVYLHFRSNTLIAFAS